MNVTLNTYANNVSAYNMEEMAANQKQAEQPKTEKTEDYTVFSDEGMNAVLEQKNPFRKMEAAVYHGDVEALKKAAKEYCKNTLPVNWDRVVDPDRKIYGAAYVESLLTQYKQQEEKVISYYAEAHQENLTYDDPYKHILMKYVFKNSPFFRADMSATERQKALEQERALLWGGSIDMADPYALKNQGGAINIKEADKIAHQAARDKIDELIRRVHI
ncbi:MAG: DUF4885 domain-containing protein [Clostridium sp.]|nr:DUF4885 domain-containing protein [Clostridium sp.]MCM1209793.1 DUF4885 domain-containing protein [Ruminococcus sp.]